MAAGPPSGHPGLGGLFVGVPDLQFESPVEAGSVLGRIYNCYGDLAAEIRAPEAGLVFGLRSRPQVRTGEWCCFFGVIEGTTSDLTGATPEAAGELRATLRRGGR